MIALVALVQSELEWPKYLSSEPLLEINSLIGFESLSRSFRKFCSLLSKTWKNIF